MIKNETYYQPKTLAEALEILSAEGENLSILAGGSDLNVWRREGWGLDKGILDITRINGLRSIKEKNRTIKMGPLTTCTDIEESSLLKKVAPVLVCAANEFGSVQIRNLGTIGGNVSTGSPAGDLLPPLYVLEAKLKLESKDESREISVVEFYAGPKKTIRKADELLTEISFPKLNGKMQWYFWKLGPRKALAISVVTLAGSIIYDKNSKTINEVRIALGSVAPTVVRASNTEGLLTGEKLTEGLIEEATETIATDCSPITDIRGSAWYRTEMVKVLFKDFIKQTAGNDF